MDCTCDTHCHLFHTPHFTQVIEEAFAQGVTKFFIPSVHKDDFLHNWQQVQDFPYHTHCHLGLGYHPEHTLAFTEEQYTAIPWQEVEFIGEIGLDKRYLPDIALEKQIEVFCTMLHVAGEHQLPVHIHCVHLDYKVLEILQTLKKVYPQLHGIMHAFGGSYAQACEFVNLGFKLGIGAGIMRENPKKLIAVVQKIGAEYLVLESDYPYMRFRISADKMHTVTPADMPIIAKKIHLLQQTLPA